MIRIAFTNGVARFSFIPDEEYLPTTQVTCVGIDTNGQRFETHRLINLEQLPNRVDIDLLTTLVEPGENATLRITSGIHSTVSLLAIDQSKVLVEKSFALIDLTFS